MHKPLKLLLLLVCLTMGKAALAQNPEPTQQQLEAAVRAWFSAIESQFKEQRGYCIEFSKPEYQPRPGRRTKEQIVSDCEETCGVGYDKCLEPFTATRIDKIGCIVLDKATYRCMFLLQARTEVPQGQKALQQFVDADNLARGIFSYTPEGLVFNPAPYDSK